MLAALLAVLLAEHFDTLLVASGSRDMFVGAATVGLGGVFSALLELGRQLALKLGVKWNIDMSKVLGGIVPVALVLVLTGCASSKSIPTSSDANVSAEVVTAKGGTIACATALSVTLDPETGNVTALTCATNGGWTDPPTTEETTALGKFGESLLGVVRLPFDVLAALGRAMGGIAPQP